MLMKELKDYNPANVMAKKMPLETIIRGYLLANPDQQHEPKILCQSALQVLARLFPGIDVFTHLFEPKKTAFRRQMTLELESFAKGEWLLLSDDALSAAMEEFAREPDLKLNELAFAA